MTKYYKVKGILSETVELVIAADSNNDALSKFHARVRSGDVKFDSPSLSSVSGTFDHETNLSIGDEVLHDKFGKGSVKEFEGIGAQQRVKVNFEESGEKWLVVNYAKLTLIEPDYLEIDMSAFAEGAYGIDLHPQMEPHIASAYLMHCGGCIGNTELKQDGKWDVEISCEPVSIDEQPGTELVDRCDTQLEAVNLLWEKRYFAFMEI